MKKKKLTTGLFTIKEAALYKKMEYEAFRWYCVQGRGPDREKFGGRWVFSKESLDNWNIDNIRKKRIIKKTKPNNESN